MSIHINKFIDRVRAAESRAAKDVIMPIDDARSLHAELTRLLLRLEEYQQYTSKQQETIQVEIQAPGFKD